MKSKKIISLFIVLFLQKQLSSQNNLSFFFKHISKIDQVVLGNIRAIAQDNKGFMWIASQDGLFRYDSKSFVIYNSKIPGTSHIIEGSDVRKICVDSAHNILWMISSFGGLNGINLINGKTEFSLSEENTPILKNVFLTSLCDNGDSLFIGTQKGVYLYIKSKRIISRLDTGVIEFNTPIDNIFKRKNRLYLFTRNDGIYIYNYLNQKISFHAGNPDISSSNELRFYNVTESGENIWYAGTSDGIKKFTFEDADNIIIDKTPFKWIPEVNSKNIFGISIDLNGCLWVSNEDNVVKIDPSNQTYSLVVENNYGEKSDWLASTYTIFCDKQNNIWLGCQKGLAFTVNTTPRFKAYSRSPNGKANISHSYYLNPIDDSTIYICAENGLYKANINNGGIEVIDATIPYDYIFTDPNKRVIVSNYSGMFILKKNVLSPLSETYPEFDQLQQLRINSCIKINDSCLVMGTENYKGIIAWDHRNHKIEQYNIASAKLPLKENVINNVVSVSEDQFAVLGDQAFTLIDLANRSSKTLPLKTNTGKDYVLFFDLCRIKDKYYLGSYGMGIIVLDKNFTILGNISTINGLSNNGIYKLLPWRDSLLFITTNNGLNIYDPGTGAIKQFFKTDGLHDDTFEETSGNIYNNIVFAGGANGFTAIYPNNIRANDHPPVVYFSNVQIELKGSKQFDTSNLDAKKFIIPNNVIQTNIYFSGINYSNPERTIFKYRITEQSNSWINLSTQNFISLIGLSPGTYHLQVQAFNEDEVSSEIKELTLTFLPKWYQTWIFKLLVLLVIIAAVYGLYRFRINHLKKEEKIRNQVASDLHDELGSTLNSVKVFANLALMEENKITHLEKIKEATQSAISGVKDIIWVLDDKRDTLDHLLSRINQFAKPICEAAGISYNQQSGGNENYKLGKEEKRNLYMIIKETINNSIKYSECSVIELLVKNKGSKINITVSDNGKGFDKEKTNSGYGLKNILHRAEEIGYHAEINSSLGNGTLIYLEKK